MPDKNDVLIEALRRERAGYVLRGLPERVAEVDVQLARLGAPTEGAGPRRRKTAAPAAETAAVEQPETRG